MNTLKTKILEYLKIKRKKFNIDNLQPQKLIQLVQLERHKKLEKNQSLKKR